MQGMTTQIKPAHDEPGNFQAILEARAAELERGSCLRDNIAIEQSPDPIDEIQRAAERALAIGQIDRESKQLREVRAALRRFREGTFGVCEHCEEPIHAKRLRAIPWSSLCIQCQEAVDCHPVGPASTNCFMDNAA